MWMRWARTYLAHSLRVLLQFMVILRIQFSLVRWISLLSVLFLFSLLHSPSCTFVSLIFESCPTGRIIQSKQINWNEKCRQCVEKSNWCFFLSVFFIQTKRMHRIRSLDPFFTSYAFLLTSSCYRILISLCENHHRLCKYWQINKYINSKNRSHTLRRRNNRMYIELCNDIDNDNKTMMLKNTHTRHTRNFLVVSVVMKRRGEKIHKILTYISSRSIFHRSIAACGR